MNSGETSGHSGSGRGGVASEESEGEDEESSSQFLDQQMACVSLESTDNERPNQEKTSVETALSNFRQQWQRELESPIKTVVKKNSNQKKADTDVTLSSDRKVNTIETDEEKAKNLFLKGADHERNGDLYEAIKFYKRAVQLVPDIELKIYESTKVKSKIGNEPTMKKPEKSLPDNKNVEEVKELDSEEILVKIGKIVQKNGYVCLPAFEQKSTHISALPNELLMYILRWVVSSELDMTSLERFSGVCRGFYMFARDFELWRLACIKTWGINCGSLKALGYKTWRQMYIERPRLWNNGCYISMTTYMRPGENSFQDQFYRPWHLIKYFRYLRFFPDGIVLMMTTSDEPIMCLDRLKQRYSRAQGVLSGHYRLNGDKVVIVVGKSANGQNKQSQSNNTRFRSRKKDNAQESVENTFHLELQLKSHAPHMFCSLVWRSYTVFAKNNVTSAVTATNFEIVKNKFPSFKFCKVDKYHAKADIPLQ